MPEKKKDRIKEIVSKRARLNERIAGDTFDNRPRTVPKIDPRPELRGAPPDTRTAKEIMRADLKRRASEAIKSRFKKKKRLTEGDHALAKREGIDLDELFGLKRAR